MPDDFKLEQIRIGPSGNANPDFVIHNQTGDHERQPITDIKITRQVFETMRREVEQALDDEQEYLIFTSRNDGIADTIIPIGRRALSGAGFTYDPTETGYNPNNAYHVIRRRSQQGYRLVADFHNHPPRTGEIMSRNNKPVTDGIGPSGSDVSHFSHVVREGFGVNMVRIIGGMMGGKPIYKAFEILRKPTQDELLEVTFFAGGDWSDEDMELNIRYGDLDKMKQRGIVREIPITIS
jgi:hypothetical protein